MKSCNVCRIPKYLDDFHKNAKVVDGHSDTCKLCAKARAKAHYLAHRAEKIAYQREWARTHPTNVTMNQRRWHLQKLYGITLEEYDELLEAQHGRCAICDNDQPGGKRQFFGVDHNHETGEVRGLLCGSCNTGLGRFDDDSNLLILAAGYLDFYSSRDEKSSCS